MGKQEQQLHLAPTKRPCQCLFPASAVGRWYLQIQVTGND